MCNNREDLRFLILNYEEPLVFKGLLQWEMLKFNLDKWKDVFGGELLRYRCGKWIKTKNPQWEKNSDYLEGTFAEFLEFANSTDKFAYCDYNHLVEHFTNISELQHGISWDNFGFPEYDATKSTIWIGTTGAHTNCHRDTYGCNLVAQVHGRKRWLLFPPDEDLQATRVPYEESSIFSKLNLFSPDDVKEFDGIRRCKSIILEPGDVLFVPKHWWHYVENLETSVSVNIWIEKDSDAEDHLKESLVQVFVSNLVKDLDLATRETVLTPSSNNFDQQIESTSSLRIIGHFKAKLKSSRKSNKRKKTTSTSKNIDATLHAYKTSISSVPDLQLSEFREFLLLQRNRFPTNDQNDSKTEIVEHNGILNDVINAFTADNVLDLVKQNLLST